MAKLYDDWVMFLGFRDHHYNAVLTILDNYKKELAAGVKQEDALRELVDLLFSSRSVVYIDYSCCIDVTKMHLKPDQLDHIYGHWVDIGGLRHIVDKVHAINIGWTEEMDYTEDFDSYGIDLFEDLEYSFVIGVTVNGDIVMNTKEKFGTNNKQREYYRTVGHEQYLTELIQDMARKMYSLKLPEVPAGILKLPTSFAEEVES